MQREEIIELAKGNKIDEREKLLTSKSYHISSLSTILAILLIMFLRSSKGILFSQDLLLIIMVQVSTVGLYMFIKLKNPLYLLTFVLGLIAFSLSLMNVLIEYGYIH